MVGSAPREDMCSLPSTPEVLFFVSYRLASIACSQTRQPTAMNQMVRGQACREARWGDSGMSTLFVSDSIGPAPLCGGTRVGLERTLHVAGWVVSPFSSLSLNCVPPGLQRLYSTPSHSAQAPIPPQPCCPVCLLLSICLPSPVMQQVPGWELELRKRNGQPWKQ